jgi:hypothetical protein
MVSENLLIKLADEHQRFLKSPLWAIIRARCVEYQNRQQAYNKNHIRNKDWDTVSRTQGMIDGVDEMIRITERLGQEIKENSLDVDAALRVIENKPE